MRKSTATDPVIIKPVWWRHACFTLFLFVVAVFFSFVGHFGPLISWAGTIIMSIVSLLSLLDQIFEWSRLCIDQKGYHLRGWFKNHFFAHYEIENFEVVEYSGKKLLTVNLTAGTRERLNLPDQPLPFPCSFGRPVNEILPILNASIDRTPRRRLQS